MGRGLACACVTLAWVWPCSNGAHGGSVGWLSLVLKLRLVQPGSKASTMMFLVPVALFMLLSVGSSTVLLVLYVTLAYEEFLSQLTRVTHGINLQLPTSMVIKSVQHG